MILTVGGLKGGGGKSTVATNLAIMRAKAGFDVLLVDADDQETAWDFTALRTERLKEAGYACVKVTGPPVKHEVAKMAKRFDDTIIDVGGRDTQGQRSALVVTDLLLVPFIPRSFDVWTIEKVGDLIEEMRVHNNRDMKAACFLNRADARGQDNEDTAELLRAQKRCSFINDVFLGSRKSFANAAAYGLSVVEMKPCDPKACEEIGALYNYVWGKKYKAFRESLP